MAHPSLPSNRTPNNPVPALLQDAVKAVHGLLSAADLWNHPEAVELEDAIMQFICINEWDPLDDLPDDTVLTIEQLESNRAAWREALGSVTPAPDAEVAHSGKMTAGDLAWLRQMGITGRAARCRKN